MTELNKFDICPCAVTIALLSSKWKVLIIRELLKKPQRYSSLEKNVVGISQKMLTQSLKEMAQDKLVSRKVFPEIPPRVEYSLTNLGRSLRPVIVALNQWGIDFINKSNDNYLAKRFDIHEPGNYWLKVPDD